MSSPTLYEIIGKDNAPLGTAKTKIYSLFPVSRSRNAAEFLREVGELIVTDIIPYCKGQQEGVEAPDFKLSDVAAIQSVGGKVQAAEFVLCVQTYLENLEYCQRTLEKGDTGQVDARELDETITYLNEAQENARDAIAFLNDTFPAAPLNEDKEIDAAVIRGNYFLEKNPDQEIILELNRGRGQNLCWETADAKSGHQISLAFLEAVKGGEDTMSPDGLGASIRQIFVGANKNPDSSHKMLIDPRPDCGIQQVALVPKKAFG